MMLRPPCIFAALALTLVVVGCRVRSDRGFVGTHGRDGDIVTIGAGRAVVNDDGSKYWWLWYIVDPHTRTCWFKIGDSVGQLDCCRLRYVEEAVRHVSWLGKAECEYLTKGHLRDERARPVQPLLPFPPDSPASAEQAPDAASSTAGEAAQSPTAPGGAEAAEPQPTTAPVAPPGAPPAARP